MEDETNLKKVRDRYRFNVRNTKVKIPISQTKKIFYSNDKYSTALDVLVASSDFTNDEEGGLIFLGANFDKYNGIIIIRSPELYKHINGNDDGIFNAEEDHKRDEKRNLIVTDIYLDEQDVFRAAYDGSLSDLLKRLDIKTF